MCQPTALSARVPAGAAAVAANLAKAAEAPAVGWAGVGNVGLVGSATVSALTGKHIDTAPRAHVHLT